MAKIELKDVKSLDDYNRIRPEVRERIQAVKEPRRVFVGDYLTFLFENHETMLYQVHEMIRAESLRDEEAIRHEVDTYNSMIADPYELKATLLIEITDETVRKVKLKELVGLEKEVSLLIDKDYQIAAQFDESQIDEKLSSVQFISFDLGKKATEAFLNTDNVEMLITHPACSYRVALEPKQLEALRQDLRDAMA